MGDNFIWKPNSKNPKPGNGIPFLIATSAWDGSAPTITVNGKTYTGKQYGGTGEGAAQFIFPAELRGMSNLELSYGGKKYTMANGSMAYRGEGLDNMKESSNGAMGAGGVAGAGFPPGFAPGSIGFGAFPAFLGGLFPNPATIPFDPIEAAPYDPTDPMAFAKSYGQFNRDELVKNWQLAKDMGLDTLRTELQGLQAFVPAASALKRQETSIDNLFNQQERTRQIDTAMPGVRSQLDAQGKRAEAYASGRMPSSIDDRGLELGIRTDAADRATAGGFGAQSSVARKSSDLMSSQQRLQVAMQGENLLNSNISTKSQLLMAPTEYSNAGGQVNVMPSTSAGAAAVQFQNDINQWSMINPTNALSTDVNQKQFKTNLEQSTRQINASGRLQVDVANAGILNNFALEKFGYLASYAGALAGALQNNINTGVSIAQQHEAMTVLENAANKARESGDWSSVASLLTTLFGAGIIEGLINSKDKGKDKPPTQTPPSQNPPTQTPPSQTPPSQNPPDGQKPPYKPPSQGGIDNKPPSGGTVNTESVNDPLNDSSTVLPPDLDSNTGRSIRVAADAFTNSTGIQLSRDEAATSVHQSRKAFEAAGISTTPSKDSIAVGVTADGKVLYSDARLAKSNDLSHAVKAADNIYNLGKDLVFSDSDKTRWESFYNRESMSQLIYRLGEFKRTGDQKNFIATLQKAFGVLSNATAR